uniref:Doublecortin domain containing 2B n=1 Tax=Podarcis muralis TaxID=64176 RepID=A0A670JU51_PODMU
MSSGTVAVAPVAKNVMVYRNGDPFFHGRKFVVSHRRFLTFEAFLNEVTSTIHAPTAIRSIYTPRHGHRVSDLGELQNGCQYVAGGFERFKRSLVVNNNFGVSGLQSYPVIPQKMPVSTHWRKQANLPCIIHVFRNGDLLSPPFRLILNKSTLQEWSAVLSILSIKANLRTGAVRRLCKLNGDAVSTGEDLVSGNYYVAVGLEKYKDLPYFELLVVEVTGGWFKCHSLDGYKSVNTSPSPLLRGCVHAAKTWILLVEGGRAGTRLPGGSVCHMVGSVVLMQNGQPMFFLTIFYEKNIVF